MSRTKEMPRTGAFLRSSSHLLQTRFGGSWGRGHTLAIAPSKRPPGRSTNRNHAMGLPSSLSFSHRPVTVGSAEWAGSENAPSAANVARTSTDSFALTAGFLLNPDIPIESTHSLYNMAVSRTMGLHFGPVREPVGI